MVKEEYKKVSVSSERLAKKESHFPIKTKIKETSPLRQPPYFLLCKKTLVSIATAFGLELLDEGLVRKSLNSCALLVPKIGIIRHQIPKIGDMMNVLSGATLFCKITCAPNIFMICVHMDSLGSFNTNLGTHMGHLSVEERTPEFQEPLDLRPWIFFINGVLCFLKINGNGMEKEESSFFHGLFLNGWRLLSPLFLCLPLHLHGGKSPLKDPIEAQRSSLHRSPTSKLPSSGIRAQELQLAPCGACRPWIFFINKVLCFLEINGSGMEKEERLDPLTRYESLATFIWKQMTPPCNMECNSTRPAIAIHILDMRRRICEPLSRYIIGNIWWPLMVFCTKHKLQKLLCHIWLAWIDILWKLFQYVFLRVKSEPNILGSSQCMELTQASSPSFLSKAHLGGEAPSSMAYSLVDGASSHLFSFVFRCISMVENHH
ncbi:hypothetical protein HKD37_10G028258 [Glycine soja]